MICTKEGLKIQPAICIIECGMVQHRFTCSSCKRKFHTADLLNQHCETQGHYSFTCPGCRHRFTSFSALRQHQDSKGHRSPPLSRQITLDASGQLGSPTSSLICVVCGAHFAGSDRFLQHLARTQHYAPPGPYQRGDASRWYARGRRITGTRERQQYFERGLQLGEQYLPYAWFGIGCALRQRKDLDSALRAFQKSLDVAPRAYRTWFAVGKLCAKIGRIEEAIDACNHAIDIDAHRDPRLRALLDTLGELQHPPPPPIIAVQPEIPPPPVIATGGDQCPVCRGSLCTRVLELGTKIIEVRSCPQCGFKERS
ncbi:MAG: hypothetical protein RBG13Loki_1433 [Promethearchaeota archaeon CR_4]|nr:MAG: hypothetical protein RBG13Loki_1433 [Candidatus Lokiarchaeota archaeon CR_4]